MKERKIDTSLSPALSPGGFKYTSDKGRSRRTALLQATRELLDEVAFDELTFAMVCDRAGIPRASAYHFFPNLGALYLGLRLFHAELLAEAVEAMDLQKFQSWQEFAKALVAQTARVVAQDKALLMVVYGIRTEETKHIGQTVDAKMAAIVYEKLNHRFVLPQIERAEQTVAIAVTIGDAIMRLSYRQTGAISPQMIDEAGLAIIAYLRCYLPEQLPIRDTSRMGN